MGVADPKSTATPATKQLKIRAFTSLYLEGLHSSWLSKFKVRKMPFLHGKLDIQSLQLLNVQGRVIPHLKALIFTWSQAVKGVAAL